MVLLVQFGLAWCLKFVVENEMKSLLLFLLELLLNLKRYYAAVHNCFLVVFQEVNTFFMMSKAVVVWSFSCLFVCVCAWLPVIIIMWTFVEHLICRWALGAWQWQLYSAVLCFYVLTYHSLTMSLTGGEGCIISTGASLLGVGSDIGGSIRMPAFFNGVFGHRPSKGQCSTIVFLSPTSVPFWLAGCCRPCF